MYILELFDDLDYPFKKKPTNEGNQTLGGDEANWAVTYDIYGSNRDVPLYTKTRKVFAPSKEAAISMLRKLVGGTNYRAVPLSESKIVEAKGLNKRVRIVTGSYKGQTGTIGEVRHGLHNKSPKMYTIDLDGGGNVMLPKEALRLVKDPVVDESEFSIHGSGSNFDSAGFERHMAKLRAQAELKKTDPMRALVNDLHAEDEYKANMRKREAAARAPSDNKQDPNWDPYNAYSANSIYTIIPTNESKGPTAKQVEAAKAKYDLLGLKIENAKRKSGGVRGSGVIGDLQRKKGEAYTKYLDLKRAFDAIKD